VVHPMLVGLLGTVLHIDLMHNVLSIAKHVI
jgi:hypothetical protein